MISTAQIAFAEDHSIKPQEEMLASGSSWTNQSGSVASLSFQLSGTQPSVYTVSGYYVNNAQGFSCRGTPYVLSGVYYINTATISFSVAWSNSSEDCRSVTGWTGYFDFGSSPVRMVTDWNLAYLSSTGGQILQGSDIFTATATVQSESLTGQ